MTRIGLVSDTHGLMRPEALDWLRGSDHIVHAGDICDPAILAALRAIAPLTAVRGNNDVGPWAETLPATAELHVEGVLIHVIHDLADFSLDAARGVRVVVSGHSHKPVVRERGGVLFVNPGSAGPRRFALPIAAGELVVSEGAATARTTVLLPPGAR